MNAEPIQITPMSNAEFFLRHVRRGAGVICTMDRGKNWLQHHFLNPDEALELVERFKDSRDIYVTMGTLREGALKRTAGDIAALCGYYVDLDCHGQDGQYKSVQEALAALAIFCKATGVPKPRYLVSSGHGLHAHWTFDEPLPRERWQEVARKFKALTEAFGLKADPTVTADPARVLRVPCTYNFRDPDNPVEVELLPIPGDGSALHEFEAAVGRGLAESGVVRVSSTPLGQSALSAAQSPAGGVASMITLPPETVQHLRSALLSMRADDYALWVKVGMALKSLGDVGRGLWLEWSLTSEKSQHD